MSELNSEYKPIDLLCLAGDKDRKTALELLKMHLNVSEF